MSLSWNATHYPTVLVLQAISTRHIYWRQLHMRNGTQYHAELLVYRFCTHNIIRRETKKHDRDWGCIRTWARVKWHLLTEYLCEQNLHQQWYPSAASVMRHLWWSHSAHNLQNCPLKCSNGKVTSTIECINSDSRTDSALFGWKRVLLLNLSHEQCCLWALQ